ncbi:MAG: HAMP domain-containing protein [Clostridia bacterium]|nr:HAMP domain-containing protein [Clostridia bacterium]
MKGVLFRRTLALFVLVLLLADIALLGAYSYFGRKTYIDLELDSLDSVMNSAKGIYEVRDDMFSSRNSFSRSLGFLSSTADVKYYYFYYGSSGIEAVTNIAEYSNAYIQSVQFDILEGQTIRKKDLLLTNNINAIAVGQPLYSTDGTTIEGGLIFVREIQHVDAAFGKLNSALQILGIGLVPVLLIIALASIRQINKPISEMTKVAIELTRGNYSVRANENVHGEIGIFARAMNRMSDTISQTIYQLDSEKRQLWYILSSFTDGVAALDNTGNLTHYNPALMKMFGAVDVKTPHDLIPDSQIWEAFRRVLETRESNTLHYTLPGDKYLWISIVPVMGENDACTGVVGLFKDVTEIENLEKMRRDYIANISHELRTPLTAVRGLLEPLSDGMIKDDAVKMRYYGIMLHEVERLSRLITDMLQLSRLQSGTEYMEKSTFNVGELIDDVYQSYRQNAQQKGIRLELDMEEDLPDVISDPDRIEQVLVILLDNAMRYAGEGGTVRISAHQDTSDVHVSVWDSGCGIAPEDMVHVFERFFKTDKSRKEGGTGLGLSIAKQIMDKLDEQITVQSEVGKWTCFTFTVKKYVSNAIALGPVDETAIVYNELNTEPGRTAGEKDSMDAPFEVLKEDKKADKARFKGRVIKKKESK